MPNLSFRFLILSFFIAHFFLPSFDLTTSVLSR